MGEHKCQTSLWISQDQQSLCGKPAAEEIEGGWYCAACAPLVRRAYERGHRAEEQAIELGDYGEKISVSMLNPGENLDNVPIRVDGDPFVHLVCKGWVDVKRISATHNAFVCRSCGFRFEFQKTNQTTGDIRRKLGGGFDV